ncbi:MAG: family efflux transporter permease subunit [Glaciihabitans sp.]|nr:family efflux transporter permease subunit [Glaciihabitans sp.]
MTTELSPVHDNTTMEALETKARHPQLGLVVVFVTQLMLVVDASIVNVALPTIRAALGFSPVSLSWVVTAYALAFAGLILLSGRVGGRVGAKRALIIGTLVFIVASAIGGLAPNSEILIAARVVQGVGAALAAPSTLVLLIANTRPGTHRARALSLFVIASGGGGAIGLILGGILTTSFGWRWVMYVNVPVGILIIVGGLLFLTETGRSFARLDFGGAATSTIAMVATVYGFTTAASLGWANVQVSASFVVAALAIVALVLIERRHSHPVVPLSMLRSIRRSAPFVAMLLVPAGMFGFFYFVALFTQMIFHFDALGTGLALVPFVLSMMIVNQFSPRLLPRFGERIFGAVGIALLVVGFMLLGGLNANSGYLTGLLAPLLIIGVGAGFTFAPITAIAFDGVSDGDTGAASSLLQAMQQLGGSVGVAVLTTVFVSVAASRGESAGISTALASGAGFLVLAFVIFTIWGRRVPLPA